MTLISLIIPSYNESENLKKLCDKLLKIIKRNKSVEVVIVNNGSTDKTIKIISNHPIFEKKNFKLKNIKKNIGWTRYIKGN